MGDPPSVSVIVPAYNAAVTLEECLAAIGRLSTRPDEVIVYIDGATDRTEAIAHEAGARVLVNGGAPRGPSHGRNTAAAAAASDYLLFVDADVVISPGALDRLRDEAVDKNAAAFGSYDDQPMSQRACSLYANLRHHFVHQNSAGEATTFWSGLGLMRRDQFLALGGFDTDMFPHPSIEDVELGTRLLAAGGRVRLVHDAFGKHCKDWTLYRVWHTDIVRRAYPWSCLIADGHTRGVDLNLSAVERLKALVALVVPVLLLGTLVRPVVLPAVVVAVGLYLFLNRRFFGFLARRLGPLDLATAVVLHWCYHCYATATYVAVVAATRLGLRSRRPRKQAAHVPAGNGALTHGIAR